MSNKHFRRGLLQRTSSSPFVVREEHEEQFEPHEELYQEYRARSMEEQRASRYNTFPFPDDNYLPDDELMEPHKGFNRWWEGCRAYYDDYYNDMYEDSYGSEIEREDLDLVYKYGDDTYYDDLTAAEDDEEPPLPAYGYFERCPATTLGAIRTRQKNWRVGRKTDRLCNRYGRPAQKSFKRPSQYRQVKYFTYTL